MDNLTGLKTKSQIHPFRHPCSSFSIIQRIFKKNGGTRTRNRPQGSGKNGKEALGNVLLLFVLSMHVWRRAPSGV